MVFLLLLACAAAAASTNATRRLGAPDLPGCRAGWAFAPAKYAFPKGGSPGRSGHWSSSCGYRHFVQHDCGSPRRVAYDCPTSVWTAAPWGGASRDAAGGARPARVAVKYGGQLGNNMFQYAFAFRLASELAFRSGRAVELRAPKMPLSWAGMRDRVVPPPPGRRLAGRPRQPPPKKPAAASNCAVVTDRDRLSKLPLCAQLEAAFRSTTCVQVNGFFEDFGHLRGWRDEFRRLFAPAGRCGDTPPPGRDEVLVHVRECDQGSVDAPRPFFSAHGQVPWKFYDAVLRGIAARRQAAGRPPPTFTVLSPPSCGSSDLVKRLGSAFGATRRASPGATEDYCFMLASSTLVLAPSTFSWWAAWFSEAEVHMPMLGAFAHQRTNNYPLGPNKGAKGGLACEKLFDKVGKSLSVDEPRYVYHDVDSGTYFGSYHRANESFTWG